jgi:hypothetical protein
MARTEPVTIERHGHAVALVVGVEKSERLKAVGLQGLQQKLMVIKK